MIDGKGEAASPPPSDTVAAGTGSQTPGAMLQEQRMRRGLSVQQSAEGLHLDPWIIEAIEGNQFLALGAPVYARGYLRKYALLLGLAPDVVIARYEGLTDTPAVPTPIPVITTTPPPRPKWPKYLVWGLIVAVVVGIGTAAFNFLMPAPQTLAEGPALGPESVTPVAMPVATPAVESESTQSQAPAPSSVAPAPAPESMPAQVPTSAPVASAATPASVADAGPTVRLRLEFNESSWVEVYDASGQRLLYDIGQPGRPRVVSGSAPLSVVVGVVSAVNVQVNDQTIVVPRRANRDSARFRIAADGSVQ